MIVVIDGPAGSGKSSTAKAVALRCGLHYLDSGAFYRAVTLIYLNNGCQREPFFDALEQTEVHVSYSNDVFTVLLDGIDVTRMIREQQVSERVSEVAAMPQARDFVNVLLREFVQKGNFIADGRDLGTIVFPNADHKFYLTADLHKRAQRRLLEMQQSGLESDYDGIIENLKSRDYMDAHRNVAPLRKADDAIEIDTTSVSFEQQVQQIVDRIRN
jgi:cytidylate kinase